MEESRNRDVIDTYPGWDTVVTQDVHYELIFNKDIRRVIYGSEVLIAAEGEIHRSFKLEAEALRVLNQAQIDCAIHGSPNDLDMYKVVSKTKISKKKL